MCRPLHYLLLQPCASDAQAAAEKWVIQPWGSPALPLSLYPPLPQSPLLPLSLLPSSIHSLPLHPSPPFTHFPPDISSHMVFQYNPCRTFVFLSPIYIFFRFSSSVFLSHSTIPAVPITFFHRSSFSYLWCISRSQTDDKKGKWRQVKERNVMGKFCVLSCVCVYANSFMQQVNLAQKDPPRR